MTQYPKGCYIENRHMILGNRKGDGFLNFPFIKGTHIKRIFGGLATTFTRSLCQGVP